MRNLVIVVLFSMCTAMPMSGFHSVPSRGDFTPRCQDREGRFYDLGINFRRPGDSYICNCTYNEGTRRTRLQCRSPLTRSQFPGGSYYRPGYVTRTKSIAADHCVFEGQIYNKNTEWTIEFGGLPLDCSCNGSAYLSCRRTSSSSSRIESRPRSGDMADYNCRIRAFRTGEHFAVRQPGGFYSICTCASAFAATCQVVTVSGQECRFPFADNGNFYSTCTSHETGRAPYCATSVYGVRPPVVSNCITSLDEFQSYLGYVFTFGGNANGARCHFPFSVRGVEYSQCTTVERGALWCSTTSNYERDGRYGFCKVSTTIQSQPSRELYNRVGEPVTIECRYNTIPSRPPPTITWYKLNDGGLRQKIFVFDGATQTGREARTAGSYSGRISMPNSRQLVIDEMTLDDAGTFECEVTYAGRQEVYRRTDLSVEGQSPNSPSNLRFLYTPRYNRMQFLWDNPQVEYDSTTLEYHEQNRGSIMRVRLMKGRNSHVTNRLRPGATYDVSVYAITDGEESPPARMTFTVPRIATETSSGRVSEGQGFPSPTEPLAEPQVTGNNIYLNWFSNPLEDIQITNWVIVYQDTVTGESKNVTLAPSADSFVISDLESGQRYRITVNAVVDNNQIEVASTVVVTEHTPIELASTPLIEDSSQTTVTLTWDAPSVEVDGYDVAYRPSDRPRAQWRVYTIPASRNPTTTLRNLRPETKYDIRITPITEQRRGVYVPFTFTTSGDEPSGSLGPPRNLQITDITRSGFLITWEPANDGNNVRRFRVMFFPTNDDSNPVVRTTSRTSYPAQGLPGGVQYTVHVQAITDESESEPVTVVATTANEVCKVDTRWRAAGETFYKMNPRGYMQNCTCYRTSIGGRWECDPILCRSANGIDYQVDDSWEQVHESGEYIEDCTCSLRGMYCRYKEAVIRPQGPVVRQPLGGRLVLECPHETVGAERPTVSWVKLTAAGRVPLYTYFGSRGVGRALVEAGQMLGRINMPNEVELHIDPIVASDSGIYECTIRYPSLLTHRTHQVRIDVAPRGESVYQPTESEVSSDNPVAAPYEPYSDEVTDNSISLSWDAPSGSVSGYIIEYSDITDEGNVRLLEVTGESAVLRGLNPSTTYRVTVIPIIDGERGEPTTVVVSTADAPEPTIAPVPRPTTTAAPVAPRPPTNLRFEAIGKTSIRAVWQIPYYLTPVDYYRVEFEPLESDQEPLSETVRTRYFVANNLEPGTAYTFRVYSVKDDIESLPIRSTVTTRPVGRISVQAFNRHRTSRVGDDVTLSCMYDLATPGMPTVTWYKRQADGSKTELAIYNTTAEAGSEFSEAETAGELAGRLESDEPDALTVRDLRASDDGSYQCQVAYPTGGGSGTTRINIIGVPPMVVFTSPAISDEETTHTLSWDVEPAPRIDRFILNVRRKGSSRKRYTTFTPPGGSRSFLFRNLKAGKTYEGSIVSSNRYGNSPESPFNFTTASNGKPDRPTGLHLSNSNPTDLTVHVTGSLNDVLFYRIRYAPEVPVDGVAEKVVEGSAKSDALTLTGMLPDTPYILHITAVNDNGESEPLRATLTTPANVPEVPLGVTVVELTPRSVRLTIDGPNDDVDYYEVTYQAVIGSDATRRQVKTEDNDQTVELTLEPDTQYRIHIVAVNENGRSPTLRTILTTPQERRPPARPTSFRAIRPRTSSASLTWGGPTDDVLYYVVEYQADSDRVPSVRNTPGRQQTVVISGLLPSTRYRVAVKAVGEGGHSPFLTDYFTTEPAAPQPSDISITGALPDEISFDLEGVDEHVDYFIVKYFALGSEDEETSFTTTDQEITLSNLQSNTTYRVTIIAVLGNDRSNPIIKEVTSAPGQVIEADEPVLPQTPTSVRIVEKGSEMASFSIESPDSLESDEDYFLIAYQPTSTFQNMQEIQANSTEVSLTNLQPDTTYQLKIKLVLDGLESDAFITYFTTENEEVHTAPTNLRALTVLDDEITMVWDEPIDLHLVWRYLVEYRQESRQDLPFTRMYVPKGKPNITLSSLDPNTDYFVRVNTIDQRRETADATSATVRTLSRPRQPTSSPSTTTETPRQLAIEAPRGVVVSRRESDRAELRWYPATNPDVIDGYLVEFEPTFNRQGSPRTARFGSEETSATLTDLTPGTEYQVRIYTVVGNRQSEPTAATFMSQLDSPSQLRAFPGRTFITITWRNPSGPRVGTRFSYRKGNGRWTEEYLPSDRTSYVIPARSDEEERIEVSVSSVGGTTESVPETLTIYPRDTQPIAADFPITGTYVDEVSDKRAAVIFENTRDYAPEGWTLTLVDEDVGVIGAPVDITPNIGSYPLKDLKSGHVYTISVEDSNGNEISRNEFMTKVSKPENARSDVVNYDTAQLSWQRPDDKVTGYLVRYKPLADREWKEVPIYELDSPSVTLTELEPVTLYEVRIISLYRDTVVERNETGIPAFLRITTPPKPEPTPEPDLPPRPASNLQFSGINEDSAVARWEPSPDLDIDAYRIFLRRTDDNSLVISSNLRSSFSRLSSLQPDTSYTLYVYAVRRSLQSEPATGTFSTVVNLPLRVDVDNVDDTSFDIIWMPATPANPLLSNYNVTVKHTDSNDQPITYTVSSFVTKQTFDDLLPGTSYDVTLTPIINDESGNPVYTRVTTNLPSPNDVAISNISDSSFTVEWSQPNSNINEYVVEYRTSDSLDNYVQAVRDVTYADITGLRQNTVYVVSVYSILNNKRSSPAIATATTRSTPSSVPSPQGVQFYDLQSPAYGPSSFSIRWRPDADLAHLVIVTPMGESEPVFEETVTDASSVQVDNLKPSTIYTVNVYAVDNDTGRRSSPISFPEETLPRSPTSIYVQESGDNSIIVTWPEVEMDDVEVDGYLIKYRPEGENVVRVEVTEPRFSSSDLPPLTKLHDFSVQTMVDHLLSEPYVYPRVIRTGPLPAPMRVNVLPEPEVGPDSYIVSWVPIPNYGGTYEVTYNPSDESQTRRLTSQPGASSQRLPRLLPGVRYVVKVFPTASPVPESTTSRGVTTDIPSPEALTVPSVTENSAVLRFTAPNYDTVTMYEVRYFPVGSPSNLRRRRVRPRSDKMVRLEGLEPDTEYTAQAITYAGLNASPPRNITFNTRPRTTTTPAPESVARDLPSPAPLDSEVLSDGIYRVSWPAYEGAVEYYKIVYTRHSGGPSAQIVVPSYLTEGELNRLTPGETYQVDVIAVLEEKQEVTIGSVDIETEGEGTGARSAVIEWVQEEDDFTRYRITATPQGNPLARPLEWIREANDTTARLTGLHPGTRYIIVVSGYSNGRYIPIKETTISTAVDSPTNLRSSRILTSSVSLEWDTPKAPIDGYSLTYQLNGRGPELTYMPAPRTNAQKTVLRNLTPGQRYVIRLYATSSAGDSLPATLWTETAVPSPSRLQAKQVTPNLIGIRWEKPVDSLTHYTLRIVGEDDQVVVDNQRIGPQEKLYTVRDLIPNTRYHLYLTAWIGDLHSQPAYRSILTPREVSGVTSKRSKPTEDGYLITWRGRSRSVEGWLVVVESEDGSERFENTVERFTKRYTLENLRVGVGYTVKIYPYSGSIYGEPSIINIPASGSSESVTTTTIWRMQSPQVTSNSVTLVWNSPLYNTPVEEYELVYKRLSEPDSAYTLTPIQPRPNDLTATIRNLEPGESYSIRLTAFHAGRRPGNDRLSVRLFANITTPLPPPSRLNMLRETDGNTVFTWPPSPIPISHYVFKYKATGGIMETEFTEMILDGSSTTLNLTSLPAGSSYEVHMYAVKGEFQSNILIFRFTIPPELANECRDRGTDQVYQVGEHWISEYLGIRVNCSCNGPQSYDCDAGNWCQTNGNIYNPGDTWRNQFENNKKELCVCEGGTGYKCYPTNCHDNGEWYDNGTVWTSHMDGMRCTCTCPTVETQPCQTRCDPV